MSITYTLGKITSVTDGAGREFEFTYSGDYLSMITAPDGSSISYTYLAGLLIRITYTDGSCLKLAYDFDSLAVAVWLLRIKTAVTLRTVQIFIQEKILRRSEATEPKEMN